MPKIFVLDTSVLLFDHNAINNFEEHNIIIPITVLEELDQFKVGNSTLNFEAREVIRFLDDISEEKGLNEWIKLGDGKGKIKIAVAKDKNLIENAEHIYGKGKNDHKILNVALMMKAKHKKTRVILVSKDINLRIKSRALGIASEDYLTGKVSDTEYLSESQPSIKDLDGEIIKEIYAKNRVTEKWDSKKAKNR